MSIAVKRPVRLSVIATDRFKTRRAAEIRAAVGCPPPFWNALVERNVETKGVTADKVVETRDELWPE